MKLMTTLARPYPKQPLMTSSAASAFFFS